MKTIILTILLLPPYSVNDEEKAYYADGEDACTYTIR
jgi:hypothetical protein